MVPFPASFREALALHIDTQRAKGAGFLFESSWKKSYSTRGVRKLLTRYATAAGIAHPVSPHRLRHFLLSWVEGPRHRRRAHPAIQRARAPAVPGGLLAVSLADLQQRYDEGHRPLPSLGAPRASRIPNRRADRCKIPAGCPTDGG
jgi:integrase